MSWFIQKKAMMKDKIFVIILTACTVCFCSCKNKNSDDFKCVYADSIHQFEYYRNTDQIVIRVDSNILYFTPDNRLQQVCTRSSFRNQKLSLKGKVFYFNKKTGFLDSIKFNEKDRQHSRTIVYDENGYNKTNLSKSYGVSLNANPARFDVSRGGGRTWMPFF